MPSFSYLNFEIKSSANIRFLDSSSNKIKLRMNALQGIPKVLQEVDDLRNNNYVGAQLTEYKNNVKKFIESIGTEVCQLIEKYESKIKYLMQENSKLKMQLSPTKQQSSPPSTRRTSSRQ
jgi:hypothetical protein